MEIRKANISDFENILKIYDIARQYMVKSGNPNQWAKNNWPPEDLVRKDIQDGKSYVCINDDNIVAVFYYDFGYKIEPTYNNIENGKWIGNDNYGVVHRIATDGTVKGVGSFCINYAYNKCKHLRIDTHEDNIPMQKLLEKNNFVKCGIIYVGENKSPRIAFEKI